MTPTKLNPRAVRTTLIALSVAVLVAACGSSTSSSSTSAAASGSSTASRPAIAACLRKHGINLPAGRRPGAGAPPSGTPGAGSATPPAGAPPSGFPGGAAGSSKFRAALKACGANLPAGRRPAQFSRQRIQKYVTCVHQHGYDLPTPNLSGNGPVFPSKIRSNAKFQAASKACQSLLAPPQPGGGPSST
jgi:hypothetical protein